MSSVLPSIGIGALSAREAEGRTNISAGEKVFISSRLFTSLDSFLFYCRKYSNLLFFMF